MTRKKVQTYELVAQCLITRDPLKGYSISRWFKPATGYEFSAESSTTEEAALQKTSATKYVRAGKTRFEITSKSKRIKEPVASEEIITEAKNESPSETHTEDTTDFVSPISNTMAMQILDELPLIGSPVPDQPLAFILDFAGNRKEYVVHVTVSRKSDREVQVWQEWYAKRKITSFWNTTLTGILLCLMGLAAICFTFVVPYLSLKHEEPKEPERVVREIIVENEARPSAKNDPELERSRKEIQTLQRQMETVSAAVKSFRAFPTNRLYKPRMNLLDSSCTLEEKLSEFFSQDALSASLDQSEVLPWIEIEWRGIGTAPDIDRIFLTNQDGKSLRDFLIKIRKANLLADTSAKTDKR